MDFGNIDPFLLMLLMSSQGTENDSSSGMNPIMLILLFSMMGNSDPKLGDFFPIGGGDLSSADNPYLQEVLDIGTAFLIKSAFPF